jgi:hypothetical protein
MDWKGYVIAIFSLLFCQGRSIIVCIIKHRSFQFFDKPLREENNLAVD